MKIQIPSNFKQIELTITYINTLLKFQEIPKKIILQDSYFNEIPTTFIVSFVWQTLFSIKLLTIDHTWIKAYDYIEQVPPLNSWRSL